MLLTSGCLDAETNFSLFNYSLGFREAAEFCNARTDGVLAQLTEENHFDFVSHLLRPLEDDFVTALEMNQNLDSFWIGLGDVLDFGGAANTDRFTSYLDIEVDSSSFFSAPGVHPWDANQPDDFQGNQNCVRWKLPSQASNEETEALSEGVGDDFSCSKRLMFLCQSTCLTDSYDLSTNETSDNADGDNETDQVAVEEDTNSDSDLYTVLIFLSVAILTLLILAIFFRYRRAQRGKGQREGESVKEETRLSSYATRQEFEENVMTVNPMRGEDGGSLEQMENASSVMYTNNTLRTKLENVLEPDFTAEEAIQASQTRGNYNTHNLISEMSLPRTRVLPGSFVSSFGGYSKRGSIAESEAAASMMSELEKELLGRGRASFTQAPTTQFKEVQ